MKLPRRNFLRLAAGAAALPIPFTDRAGASLSVTAGAHLRWCSRRHGQIHFRVSGLEASLQRSLQSTLGLGGLRTLAEKIGIATEVLGRRESDRVDPVLERAEARRREIAYPMRQ